MAIMSLMKQYTPELPNFGYIYEPELPPVDFNRFGLNEYTENIALPTLRADWATFNSIFMLLTTTVNVATLVGAANTVDSTIQIYPSRFAVLGQGPGLVQAGFAAPPAIPGMVQTTLFAGLPTIFISLARPQNFMGFFTGVFNWDITIRVNGAIYIKTGVTDVYNYV